MRHEILYAMSEKPANRLDTLVTEASARLEAADLCYGHGTDNARDEAVFIAAHALDLNPYEALDPSTPVSAQQRRMALEWVGRRITTRQPAAYLLRRAWFAGMPFYVDERVLVPRSPIAELIQEQFAPWLVNTPRRILDLCTGSACIAIACAQVFPDAQVDAVELSADALEVARRNVADYDLQQRVHLLQGDLWEPVDADARYDLVVSNPPYVPLHALDNLPDEYKHEPAVGFIAGDDGLSIVTRILGQARDYLNDHGLLVVEVGESWQRLEAAMPQWPFIWLDFEAGGEGVFALNAADWPR